MKPVTTRTKLLTLLLLFAVLSSSLPALALSNASQTNLNSQGIKPQATATTGDWYFYIKDHLGSTMMLTDSTGEPVLDLNYEAYGEHYEVSPTTNQAVADANNFLYTGQQLDKDIGQYYLRARFYDAKLGHFTVRDPIRTQGGINMYTYVNGNPINFIDPTGNYAEVSVDSATNTVNIVVPLEFYGKGASQEVVDKFKSDIEGVWNDRQIGKYKVYLNVKASIVKADRTDPVPEKTNRVLLYGPRVNKRSRSSFSRRSASWRIGRAGQGKNSPAAHETAHLMGLSGFTPIIVDGKRGLYNWGDRYVEIKNSRGYVIGSKPEPGWEDNIMGGAGLTGVTEKQLQRIIDKSGQ